MIQLSEKYRLSFEDKHNVILEKQSIVGDNPVTRKKSERSGEVEWKQISFHPTIRPAIKAYFEIELRQSESMKDLFFRLNKLEEDMEKLFDYKTYVPENDDSVQAESKN